MSKNDLPVAKQSNNEALINLIMLIITTGGLILFSVIGKFIQKHKEKPKIKIDTFDKYDIEAFLKGA